MTTNHVPTMKEAKKNNERLYKEALEAIENLFTDTNVSQGRAKENLKHLRNEIDTMIESLDASEED